MSLQINNPGDRYEVFEARAGDRTHDLQINRCPRCDRFGIVSGVHEYYGKIYHCACNDVFWVISPETGEKLEGG